LITHDVGRQIFWGFENVKGKFVYEIQSVHEIEYPFRVCDKALYLHVLPSKALVVGIWKAGNSDTELHLLQALRGRLVYYVPQAS